MSSITEWPLTQEGHPVDSVPVLSGVSQIEADMKAALLDAFGVPSRIVHSALNDRFTATVFGNYLMYVDLLVPENRKDEALALLASEGESEDET